MKKNSAPLAVLLGVIATMSLAIACAESAPKRAVAPPARPNVDWNSLALDTFALGTLPLAATNFTRNYTPLLADTVGPFDSSGVILYEYNGARHYHPISVSLRILRLLNGFVATGDSAFLLLARKHCDKFMEIALYEDSVAWIPYTFEFNLHNDVTRRAEAPWFSGMAQGEVLQAFLFASAITGDSSYRSFCDKLFASFQRIWGGSKNWGVWIDSAGYYWIESYPRPKPDMTFSGYFAGLFGVYQYWTVTKNPEAEKLTRAGLATIERYAPLYRRPKQLSRYCLADSGAVDMGYHIFHINLLRKLGEMSANPFFSAFADTLATDTLRGASGATK